VTVYGKTVVVRILVIDALWYIVGGSRRMRLVLVRGFPGHHHNDVSFSTDPTLSPRHIIETFAMRWSIELTFHDVTGRFENTSSRRSTTWTPARSSGPPAVALSALSDGPTPSRSTQQRPPKAVETGSG